MRLTIDESQAYCNSLRLELYEAAVAHVAQLRG